MKDVYDGSIVTRNHLMKISWSMIIEPPYIIKIFKLMQLLIIEMYKVKHKLSQEITGDIFIKAPHLNSEGHGTENITYLGLKIWDIVSAETKQKRSLNTFKESIKI